MCESLHLAGGEEPLSLIHSFVSVDTQHCRDQIKKAIKPLAWDFSCMVVVGVLLVEWASKV